jgi:hypothetical protein
MSDIYTITLSDGVTTFNVYPLESNGPNNVSIPRKIQVTNLGASFELVGDLTYRFVAGQVFTVENSGGIGSPALPNNGTYTVLGSGSPLTGSTYDSGTNRTTIPVVETGQIVSTSLPLGQIKYSIPSAEEATSLLIPGRGYLNYGIAILESSVHSLENFAHNIAPSNPLLGQQWYDTTAEALKVWNGTEFVLSAGTGSGALPSVRSATTTTLGLYTPSGSGVGKTLIGTSGGVLTIDGVSLNVNDRVLIKNETGSNAFHNGIYDVTDLNFNNNEITDITTIADNVSLLQGKYFLISSQTQDYYIWYNVTDSVGSGIDPGPIGSPSAIGIQIDITANDTAATVATKTDAALIPIANYDSKFVDVSSQVDIINEIHIGADGTKLYILETSTDTIFQYTLSTAWDISTAAYDSLLYAVTSEETEPAGLFFKPDGTKMYVTGAQSKIFQYTLSPAWDVSTASYDSIFYTTSNVIVSLYFDQSGTKLATMADNNDLRWYNLSNPWDITSLASIGVYGLGTPYEFDSISMNSTGTVVYTPDANDTNGNVIVWTSSPPWKTRDLDYFMDYSPDKGNYRSIFTKPDDSTIYIGNTSGGSPANARIDQHHIQDPFSASVASDTITITNNAVGISTDAADADTTFSFNNITQGTIGLKETTQITTVADTAGSLVGKYFSIDAIPYDYYVWYENGGSPLIGDPAITGRRGLQVTYTTNDSANTIASLTKTAIENSGAFTVEFVGSPATNVISVTNIDEGAVSDVIDGGGSPALETGFTFGVTQQGAGIAEVVDITMVDDTGPLNNTYFLLDAVSSSHYVWFNTDASGTDPAIGGRVGIQVNINSLDDDNTIASKMQTAIAAYTEGPGSPETSPYSAAIGGSPLTNTVTITNTTVGDVTDITDGSGNESTGFAFIVVQQGGLSYVITRATDSDEDTEVLPGQVVIVEEGSQNADSGWILTADGTITIDTTAIAYTRFGGKAMFPDYNLQVGTGGDEGGSPFTPIVYTTSFDFSTAPSGKSTVQVFVNGIKQVEGADKAYVATAPNTITFNPSAASIPDTGDDVEFYGFG